MPKVLEEGLELVDFKKANQHKLDQAALLKKDATEKNAQEQKNILTKIEQIEAMNKHEQARLDKFKSEDELLQVDFYTEEAASPRNTNCIELTDFKKARAASLFFEMYNGLHQLTKEISTPEAESPMARTDLSATSIQMMRKRYDPTK